MTTQVRWIREMKGKNNTIKKGDVTAVSDVQAEEMAAREWVEPLDEPLKSKVKAWPRIKVRWLLNSSDHKKGDVAELYKPYADEMARRKFAELVEDTLASCDDKDKAVTNAPELDRLIFRLREVMLPTRRFLKLNSDKSPKAESFEWQNDPWGIDDLPSWPRWGIAGRDGLVLVDCDLPKTEALIREALPPTFEVKTARRGLTHFYFKVIEDQVPNMTLKIDGKAAGEVRANNHYVVAPGTELNFIDKDGKQVKGKYEIQADRRIATVPYQTFMTAIEPLTGTESERKLTFEVIEKGVDVGERHARVHQLATFLVGVQKMDYDTALFTVRQWNQTHCRPPINDKDIVRSVKNAVKFVKKVASEKGNNAELDNVSPSDTYFNERYRFAHPVRISELSASMVGKQVVVDGQILGERSKMVIPKTIRVECSVCGISELIDVAKNPPILQTCVFNSRDLLKDEAKKIFDVKHRDPCNTGQDHRLRIYKTDYLDYAMLRVRDPLEKLGLVKFDKRMHEPRDVHLVGQTVPNAKKVKLQGTIVVDNDRNIVVLADHIEALESEAANFIATDLDKKAWAEHFVNKEVYKEIAPHIVGEKREIAKKFVSLVYHSPAMIPDLHGRTILGRINVAFFGDTTAGKSQTAKSLTDGSDDGWTVPLGTYVVAETSGRTGFLYTIDNDHHMLIWGELVLNDLGLVVVDGLEQISPEEFSEFREAIRTGKISVRRALAGDAWVRTRLITCFNPKKPLSQYLYSSQGIADTWTFENPTNITRWDIFLPFALSDVPPNEIANGNAEERPIPPEVYARHVYWVWSRKPEQIIYEHDAAELIKTDTTRIINTYSTQSLPIVSNESINTICRLCVARAAERHSTDENYEKIIVRTDHVESAIKDFEDVLRLLKLGEYKLDEEKRLTITDNEFAKICMDLDDVDWKVLDHTKFKGASSTNLAKEFGLSDTTIKTHFGKLKGHELIETKPGVGVEITPRGIVFLRLVQIKGKQVPPKHEVQQKFPEETLS